MTTKPDSSSIPSIEEFLRQLKARGVRRRGRRFLLDPVADAVDAILEQGHTPLDVHEYATLSGIKLSKSTAYKFCARRRKKLEAENRKKGKLA